MTDAWRLQQALSAIHSGLRQMAEEDGEISVDIAADLPDEVSALEDAMRGVVRSIQDAAALADAAEAQSMALDVRVDRFRARERRLRGLLMAGMDAMGWGKREWPEATVSLRAATPTLYITDEAVLPPEYIETRTTLHPKRKEIAAALKAGQDVPGVALANGMPVLTLRGN